MNKTTERRSDNRRLVEPQESLGFLEHESSRSAVKVIDRSAGGFTVAIPPEQAQQFPGGENATLAIGSQYYTVMISGSFREGNRKSHLGLKLVATEEPPKRNTHRISNPVTKENTSSSRDRFTFGLVMALLLALVALPGIGDLLGTAPLIRVAIQSSIGWFGNL